MRIVPIFDTENLFAFHFEVDENNVFIELMNNWTDAEFVHDFFKKNKRDIPTNVDISKLRKQIEKDTEYIEEKLLELSQMNPPDFNSFFKLLNNNEYKITELQFQKGRKNYLRIYAIKIDEDVFVITGGAIKFTDKMNQADHTIKEWARINHCKDFLKENGVYDSESFYELILEQ